jgi:carbonic anhydrase/acetyltransferase-like protein (isoleucine patch superfamily)
MVVEAFRGKAPEIHATAFVSPLAYLSGKVSIGEESGVFPGASLRGDYAPIKVGARSSVQDCAVLHAGWSPCVVGDQVTVAHNAVLHGCTVGSNSIVGIHATVLDEARIGEWCIVAAGSVVTSRTVIEPNSMVSGTPAKVTGTLTDKQRRIIEDSWKSYRETIKAYWKQSQKKSDSSNTG